MKKRAQHKCEVKSLRHLTISRKEYGCISRRTEVAANNGLREICGNFSIDRFGRVKVRLVSNRTSLPCSHMLCRRDILPASKRGVIWGAFHSHPISRAYPSTSDRSNSFINRHILIVSDLYDEIMVWEIGRDNQLTGYPVRVV